ncbi:MAG: L,D-transpeptidase family protein [Chloroflexaceae bacterium]|nr:L,D-transpeptidase family protein [Chloroflexaceae bacterium]
MRVAAARTEAQALRDEQLTGVAENGSLPEVPSVYFSATGHHVSNRSGFLDYWRQHGQLLVLGYPVTEEIVENGRVVQYFERARLEYHPELAGTPWQVQLGLLVNELAAHMIQPPVADPLQPGVRYFLETGHTLSGIFLNYWERHGGLPLFGYPVSEQLEEGDYIVQYFERARLEYHPEHAGTFYEVLVGDMGRQAAQTRGLPMMPVPQLAGAPEWTTVLWARRIEVNLSTQWLTAYEGNLPVFNAPVATGKDGFNTPTGSFAIYDKLTIQDMKGTAGGETWYVPNVRWVMYIYGGVALHGTYWHDAFGTGIRMSHGCINLRESDAQRLYEWTSIGTPVLVYY